MNAREAGAVAAGGALGAVTRYGLVTAWPDGASFPWTTFAVNVTGCLAIGALAGFAGRLPALVARFLGTGFLGGYTTFSAYAVQATHLRPGIAAAYVVGTLLAALAAVQLGQRMARR